MPVTPITTQGGRVVFDTFASPVETSTYSGTIAEPFAAMALSDDYPVLVGNTQPDPGSFNTTYFWDGAAVPALSDAEDDLEFIFSSGAGLKASALRTNWSFDIPENGFVMATDKYELTTLWTHPAEHATTPSVSGGRITSPGTTFTFTGFAYPLLSAAYSGREKAHVVVTALSDTLVKKIPGKQSTLGDVTLGFIYDGVAVPATGTTAGALAITLSNSEVITCNAILSEWNFDNPSGPNGVKGTAKLSLSSPWVAAT